MLGLAFSGGKDSLACWYLYRHEKPLVFWVNTGKADPETLALIEYVRARSEFVEVNSNQEAQHLKHGLPSDLVPIDCTTLGKQFTSNSAALVQSYAEWRTADALPDQAFIVGLL